MKIITNHFFPGDEDNMTKLLRQWSQLKFFLSGRKLQIPAGNQSSTFFMSFMLKDKGIFQHSMSEELFFVAEVGLSLPCSNAWPERGGGVINITKTKFCNHPGHKINFFSSSHLAPKYFKVVANSKKLVAIMTHEKKNFTLSLY